MEMKQNGAPHANSSVLRIYLPRHDGGRGLTNLEHPLEQECLSCAQYLTNSEDPQVKGAMAFQNKLRECNFQSLLDVPLYVVNKYQLDVDLTQREPGQPSRK